MVHQGSKQLCDSPADTWYLALQQADQCIIGLGGGGGTQMRVCGGRVGGATVSCCTCQSACGELCVHVQLAAATAVHAL